MIIDTFMFNNELDILEIRLEELYDKVDFFVAVESTKTQTLLDKPLYLSGNIHRFEKYKDKLIVHVVDKGFPDNKKNLWQMENFQRNQILKALEGRGFPQNSCIMVSDVDEIPQARIIDDIIMRVAIIGNLSINMKFFAYYLNIISPEKRWIGTVAGSYKSLKSMTPQGFRDIKDHLPILDGGWHLSWMGGFDKFYKKIYSCIEPLDKRKIPSKEECRKIFDSMIRDSGNFIHIDDTMNFSVRLKKINNLQNTLPNYVVNNLEKFKNLILN